MESPFYKIDNLESLRDSKDMKWIDGWELIRRGFGLTDQNTYTTDPVPNAYLILYNKYTGYFRNINLIVRDFYGNVKKVIYNGTTTKGMNLYYFSTSDLTAGTYNISLLYNNVTETKQLIISR